MLDKKHRLVGRSILEKVKKEGSLHQSESFGLIVNGQEKTGLSRFAFVVSTKVAKNAVERNKVRRKLREIVRQEAKDIKEGYDVVFLVKKNALRKKASILEAEVKKIFRESGIAK